MTPFDALQVQRFDALYDATPSATLHLADVLEAITDGVYVSAIRHVRTVLARHGEAAYVTAKRQLPQITFAGTFTPTRAKDHLVQHSEIAHADIDHLADVQATKAQLQEDPHVLYCFTSPRGDGLKYGVRIAPVPSDAAYKHAWGVLAAAHQHAYGVTWDPSGKDICRLCFVSWDPACYINPDAEVYAVPPPMATPPPPRRGEAVVLPRERREWYAQRAITMATRLITESVEGQLHHARCKAGYLLGGYVGGGLLSYAEAYDALAAAVAGHTKHLAPSLKTIAACLHAGEAEPITLAEREADWERWKALHPRYPQQDTPDMTHPITPRPLASLPRLAWDHQTAPLKGRIVSPAPLGRRSA